MCKAVKIICILLLMLSPYKTLLKLHSFFCFLQKGKPDVLSSYFIAGRNKSQSKTDSSASLALSAENGDSGCISVDVDCDSDVTIDGDPMSNPPAQNSNNSDCLWSAKLTNSEPDTHQSGHSEAKSNQNDSDCGSSDRPGSFSTQSSNSHLGFSSPVSKPLQSAAGLSCNTPSGPSSTLFGSGLLSPSATTGSIIEILINLSAFCL